MADLTARRFAWIVALSLVLHALLLGALPLGAISRPEQVKARHSPLIVATLRQAAQPKVYSPAGLLAKAPPPVASAAVLPKVRPSPLVAAHALAASPQWVAEPTSAAAPAAAGASFGQLEAVTAVPAAPAAVAEPRSVSAQSDLLVTYRQRLSALLAGQQEYPRIAALRGWQGEVRLRLRVARKGNLLGVELDHSSGFDVLDRHAVAMLEALAGLPPLPDALQANEIQVVVPINYKLKKST
jgi:periplasmic protein TonB